MAGTLRDAIGTPQLSQLYWGSPLKVNIGIAPFAQNDTLESCWAQAERALKQAYQTGYGKIAAPPAMGLLPLSIAYEPP